jgi:hypothetical protein
MIVAWELEAQSKTPRDELMSDGRGFMVMGISKKSNGGQRPTATFLAFGLT